MKINQFFQEKLGVKLKHHIQSWGATDLFSNRVFLRVWGDQIEKYGKGKRVQVSWPQVGGSWGFAERRRHIDAIKAGAEGIAIICYVVDPSPVGPRKIKRFDESPLYRLGEFTEDAGLIYAEIREPILLTDLIPPASALPTDLKAIIANNRLNPTSKEALINARVGQGAFRSMVLQTWNYCCSVTGSSTLYAIRASHIKPWRDSTDAERLDPKNGLPFVANLDALFDAGLISFEPSGCMLISSELSQAERDILGLAKKKLSQKPTLETAGYLDYHRTKLFRK